MSTNLYLASIPTDNDQFCVNVQRHHILMRIIASNINKTLVGPGI